MIISMRAIELKALMRLQSRIGLGRQLLSALQSNGNKELNLIRAIIDDLCGYFKWPTAS